MPISGLDEVTELHRDAAGNIVASHWTRDWVEGAWRLNGQLPSVGGLTFSPAPSMPAANDSSINAPIEMSSEGTQKLVVQYTGSPEEMPSEIGIVLSSTADSYYRSSGSADADNGLGNDSFYVIPGGDYSLVGLGGEYSTGKNLRIIKLDGSGHGELMFSSSAHSTSSGNGAQVWAEARNASATSDPRNIKLLVPGHSVFYRKGDSPNLQTINKTYIYGTDPNQYPTYSWSYLAYQPAPIVPAATSLYSMFTSTEIGVPRSNALTGGVNEEFNTEFIGVSYFPSNMWENNRHGSYWLNLNYGELDHDDIAYETTTQNHFGPLNIYRVVGFNGALEVYTQDSGSVGTSKSVAFDVNWSDGVKGKAVIERKFVDAAQPHMYGPTEIYFNESAPFEFLAPVPGINVGTDGYVNVGITSHEFWIQPSAEFLIDGSQMLQVGMDFAGVILGDHPLAGPAIASVHIGLTTAFNSFLQSMVENMSPMGVAESNRIGPSGYEAVFRANPIGFRWTIAVKRKLHVRLSTVSAFGSAGFEGTVVQENQQLDPDKTAVRYALGKMP